MPWSGQEGNESVRLNFFVELIVARPVSDQLLNVRYYGHGCAGPFVSRNLEA
jgi:hypothetical protein